LLIFFKAAEGSPVRRQAGGWQFEALRTSAQLLQVATDPQTIQLVPGVLDGGLPVGQVLDANAVGVPEEQTRHLVGFGELDRGGAGLMMNCKLAIANC
jgi:hypothetical protein